MRALIIALSLTLLSFAPDHSDFLKEQLDHPRVKDAYQRQWPTLSAKLRSLDVPEDSFHLLIRGFKFEEDVEVWVKDADSAEYRLMDTYKFCSNVGALGPKRKQGDLQIPEGLYSLSTFNPNSNFHLSLQVDYPNLSDSLKGYRPQLGGLIFIHGGCSTIGCIPITDDRIEQLYILAMMAYAGGQEPIPIQLFPARLSPENVQALQALNGRVHDSTLDFWTELLPFYRHFETQHRELQYAIDSTTGRYIILQDQGL